VSSLKHLALAAGFGLLAVAGTSPALAQTTDGFHAIQVFPLVVDSGSFTQRFTFKNPDAANAAEITLSYFPSSGVPVSCPNFTIPAGGQKVFTSLRAACPAMVAGNQFGYLYAWTAPGGDTSVNKTGNRLFSGYSRVSNPSGNGFSVEGFPAHTFTSASTVVTGLRRLAAAGGAPTFQTNCFISNLHEVTAAASVGSDIAYTVFDSAGVQIGTGAFNLMPGKMVRLLDVFAAAGAPAGDYDDASVVFSEDGPGEPGLMSFCTVQDNTSYGADFRIGKQLQGFGTQYSGIGQQDDHVVRDGIAGFDLRVSGETAGRAFSLPAGLLMNTHVVYFRHPDWVQCEIIDPATNLRATSAYGLEMRLRDQYLVTLAGGTNAQGFGRIYLGDKTERNNGTNARYSIEVGVTATTTTAKPYKLHCQSGSGHTLGDIIRFNVADQF
jgi:hypothetical protein